MHARVATIALLTLSAATLAPCAAQSDPSSAAPVPQTVRVVAGAGGSTHLTTLRGRAGVSGTFDMDIDRAWQQLPSVYAELGIPVTERNNGARTLGNPGFKVRRRLEGVPLVRYLDCGRTQGAPSAETYEILLAIRTQLTADDGRTTVSTLVDAAARPVNFSGEYSACSSTGALEQQIVDRLYRDARR
jgi:hypothetical protein